MKIPSLGPIQSIETLEKRLWDFVLLAVILILFLSLALLAYPFTDQSDSGALQAFAGRTKRYAVPLAVLILLTSAYMIAYYRKLIALSRKLMVEKESAVRLSRDVRTLSALLEVTSLINSQHHLAKILEAIARSLVLCFKADHCSIMLLDKCREKLRTQASFGSSAERAKDSELAVGQGIAGWVLKSKEPLLLQGEVSSEKFPGTPDKNGKVYSAMSVPLMIESRAIGVLNLNLYDHSRSFARSHLQLLTIFGNTAAMSIRNGLLNQEKEKRMQLQRVFEQLHSPAVYNELVTRQKGVCDPKKLRSKSDLCILFADLRGFSDLLHEISLETCTAFLDDFYAAMDRAITHHGGTIDKFIGDEVMAVFRTTESAAKAIEHGIAAAQRMVRCFGAVREKYACDFDCFKSVGLGIGVNMGNVYMGAIGSRTRIDYTIIGEPVNLTRRLCSYADSNQILVTGEFSRKLDGKIPAEFFDHVYFEGIQNPVEVYQIPVAATKDGMEAA